MSFFQVIHGQPAGSKRVTNETRTSKRRESNLCNKNKFEEKEKKIAILSLPHSSCQSKFLVVLFQQFITIILEILDNVFISG